MDNEELAKWMEQRQIGQQLQSWASNDLLGHRAYNILEDLATKGKATITINMYPDERIYLQKIGETVNIEPKQEAEIVAEPVAEMQESQETPKFVPKKMRKREL